MTTQRSSSAELRLLAPASVIETITLAALIINLATVHVAALASVVGPIHGLAYLITVALAFLVPASTGTRLLSLVPGVGGLLVLRRVRPSARPDDEPR